MKNKYLLFWNLFCVGNIFSQEFILDNGIYKEKPTYSDTSQTRYSKDNISYKTNRVFIFDYYYMDIYGVKSKFLMKKKYSEENQMNLTSFENPSDSAIDKIKLKITDNLNVFALIDSTYTQTVSSYRYLYKNDNRKSDLMWTFDLQGIIDNKKNICFASPARMSFAILDLNPFPFISLDETIQKWTSSTEIRAIWLDQRWINCKEDLTINYEYVRAKDEIITTAFGKIKCKVVNATAKAEYDKNFMRTYLKSYYYPNYGFVKLEYTNINSSKIVIDLIEMKD